MQIDLCVSFKFLRRGNRALIFESRLSQTLDRNVRKSLVIVVLIFLLFTNNTVDLDTSRSETRLSDRSASRHSRRSSVELEVAVLGDSHAGLSVADDSEHDPHFSDNEVDQFLESLKEPGKVQYLV